MVEKRNPVKQIMSAVHKDARAGKLDLRDHSGFVAEVKRRLAAAGLRDDQMPQLRVKRRRGDGER